MILSAHLDSQCLAAVLVYQIKRAIRANATIVGPYSAAARSPALVAFLSATIGQRAGDLFVVPQNGNPQRFAIGQIDLLALDILPREPYLYETGVAGSVLAESRQDFTLVAPFEGGALDTFRPGFVPLFSANGFRVRVSLEIFAYNPNNLTQQARFQALFELDVFASNVRFGAGSGVRSGISLMLQPGRLSIFEVDQTPRVDLYQSVVNEANQNRLIVTGAMTGRVNTQANDAYQQIVNPILAQVRREAVFALNGISEAVSEVLNGTFGPFTLIPLNMGMRFVASERGNYILAQLQLADGAVATELVGGAYLVENVRSFRRQLRSETEVLWREFFLRASPPRSDSLLGVSVSSSLVSFLVVTSLGRSLDELMTRLTGEARAAANQLVIDAFFSSQERVTSDLKRVAASFVEYVFRPGACAVHDFLAPEGARLLRTTSRQVIDDVRRRESQDPNSLTAEDREMLRAFAELEPARRTIASVLSRRTLRPESITATDQQLLDALEASWTERTRSIRESAVSDRLSAEEAARGFDQSLERAIVAAYDSVGTVMPPWMHEIRQAREIIERADRDCPVRAEAIDAEVARGNSRTDAVRTVTQRFERARQIQYRIAPPGRDMSTLEAREIVGQLESRCAGLSEFRRRFVGLPAMYPVLAYEYERNCRLIASGLPGRQVVERDLRNLAAGLVAPVDQFSFSRVAGPSILWSQNGVECRVTVRVLASLGVLGTILRNLVTPFSGSLAQADVDIAIRLTLGTTNQPGNQSSLEARVEVLADFSDGMLSVLGLSPFLLFALIFTPGGEQMFSESLISALFSMRGSDPSIAAMVRSALGGIFPLDRTSVTLSGDPRSASVQLLVNGFAEALLGPRSSLGSQLTFGPLLRDPMPAWAGLTSTGVSVFASPFNPQQALGLLLGVDRTFFRLLSASISFGFSRSCAEYGLLLRVDFVLAVPFDVAFSSISFVNPLAAGLSASIRLEHVWLGREGERWNRRRPPGGLFVFPAGDDGVAGLEFFLPASAILPGYQNLVGQDAGILLASSLWLPVISPGVFPPELRLDEVIVASADCQTRNVRL